MTTEVSDDHKAVVRMWLVSLGISVFCCAVFSAMAAFYIGGLSRTLTSIDNRLATLEARAMIAPAASNMAPSAVPAAPTPVTPPEPPKPPEAAPAAPAPVPEVTPPSAAAPATPPAEEKPAAPPEPITPPAAAPAQ